MNEVALLFQDLLSDLLRFEVLRQLAALVLAFGVWLVLKPQLNLEERRWPQETRWPWLTLLKPLANATLLWFYFAAASTWPDIWLVFMQSA